MLLSNIMHESHTPSLNPSRLQVLKHASRVIYFCLVVLILGKLLPFAIQSERVFSPMPAASLNIDERVIIQIGFLGPFDQSWPSYVLGKMIINRCVVPISCNPFHQQGSSLIRVVSGPSVESGWGNH